VGNYFVSNYPPYSVWSTERTGVALGALDAAPADGVPLGLYVHIPFCRKRCDFCYFKVYTDKNSSEIRRYLDGLLRELDGYLERAFLGGRELRFVYFGGGTPSYLSSEQLRTLFDGLKARLPWDAAREVTFECEPGTLQEGKAHALRELGVTRASLGIENFDADVLELNNRAHRAVEIDRAYGFLRAAGFPQINVDLIAGMIGETEENWWRCIDKTIALAPESVTIYQMEVPYNTTIYQRMQDGSREVAPVAGWETKRRWVSGAFERLERQGYRLGSAYTACTDAATFEYRDSLWHGADLLGLGVASFSHVAGVHFQNEHAFEPYLERIGAGELPIHRAHAMTPEEQLVRQFILQLKLGRLDVNYFLERFGVDVRLKFHDALRQHAEAGYLVVHGDEIRTTREGLMRIDGLLHDFFLDEHKDARYA
jgi:oxygen-independent coproporphyrinogen-3 oxidase